MLPCLRENKYKVSAQATFEKIKSNKRLSVCRNKLFEEGYWKDV
jgi:hypothetical protein